MGILWLQYDCTDRHIKENVILFQMDENDLNIMILIMIIYIYIRLMKTRGKSIMIWL